MKTGKWELEWFFSNNIFSNNKKGGDQYELAAMGAVMTSVANATPPTNPPNPEEYQSSVPFVHFLGFSAQWVWRFPK